MASLREVREAKGLTIEQLADLAHLSKGAISMIERGQRVPTYRTRRDIAAALGVAVDAIEWPEGNKSEE